MGVVRPIGEGDFEGWRLLWHAYLHFYRSEVEDDDEVAAATFDRLVTGRDGLGGIVAEGEGSDLVGLAHMVFHASTWSTAPQCYLQDLFVAPAARGTGTARALVAAVYEEADRREADRTYWETQEFNGPARSLYDTVANLTSFVIYER